MSPPSGYAPVPLDTLCHYWLTPPVISKLTVSEVLNTLNASMKFVQALPRRLFLKQ